MPAFPAGVWNFGLCRAEGANMVSLSENSSHRGADELLWQVSHHARCQSSLLGGI